MPISSVDDDILDSDPTDELPVLSEALIDAPHAATPEVATGTLEDTGTFDDTGDFERPEQERREEALAALAEDLAAREAQVTELEAEVERLKQLGDAAGSGLARHEALPGLRKQQADHDAIAARQRGEIERLAGEIDERDRRIVGLLENIDQERARVQALEDDASVLQRQLSALETEQEVELQQQARGGGGPQDAELKRLRGEVASLAQHIENRDRVWREQEAALAATRTRVRELELELEQRFRRQTIAENRADAESRDAERSREKLGEALRLMEQMRQQGRRIGWRRSEVREDTVDAAQAAEPSTLDEQLDATKVLSSALEHDPDALHRLHHLESTILDLQSRMSEQLERDAEAAAHDQTYGTLVCLTGEHPASYDLDRPAITIGRGSDCDIRILTHYVSRQHARIMAVDERAVIEDLGSRNGVFVNAVRVDRHELEENDLVTVGDTQFRFETSRSGQASNE